MKADHIGYAVKNIDKAKEAMEALGYIFEDTIKDTDRSIYIAFGNLDNLRIELVSPCGHMCGGGGTPVDSILSKSGSSPYHICYRSDNIEAEIEELRTHRFKVIVPLAPAIAFNNKRVVFMYSLSAGLIEIVEN